MLQNHFAVSATQKKYIGMDINVEIVFKRVKLGHIINDLHEKVRISVPLLIYELPQKDAHYKAMCAHWHLLCQNDSIVCV